MRNLLFYFILFLLFISCIRRNNENNRLQVYQWNLFKLKQDTILTKIDTLPINRNYVKLEQIGKLNKSIIDSIIERNIIENEYKLDSLVIWMNPIVKQEYNGTNIDLYNIFISNKKNGTEMNFVYSKEHGVLMQIYDSFTILGINKLIELDKKGKIEKEIIFSELINKLMNNKIIFPTIEVPPTPEKN